MSQRFLVSARLLASEDSLSLVERFRLISGGQEPRRLMTASLVTGALCLLFVSYLFIFQSAYDPDMEDVLTEDGANIQIPDYGEMCLVVRQDGTIVFVAESGESFQISNPDTVRDLIDSDIKIVEE